VLTEDSHPTKSALIAVSGGLDSIALLYAIILNLKKQPSLPIITDFLKATNIHQIEVAYANHHQRPDQQILEDIRVIEEITKAFNIKLHILSLNLTLGCSEDSARVERYKELHRLQKTRDLNYILTAHHCDDVVETVCMNLIRGTGIRGLCSLRFKREAILRPFLFGMENKNFIFKDDLVRFAKVNSLTWHDDSTNQSLDFFRNRLRKKLDFSNKNSKINLLELSAHSLKLVRKLDNEIFTLLAEILEGNKINRIKFKLLEVDIQHYLIHAIFSKYNIEVSTKAIERIAKFIVSAQKEKIYQAKGLHFKIKSKAIVDFTII
jgi:tRNA(Ile)-lysidine synthetase-like protein